MDFVAAAVLASAGTFAGAIGASAVVAGVVAGLVSRTARSDVAHATGSSTALPSSGDGATVTRAQVAPSAGKTGGGGGVATAPPAPAADRGAIEAELRERRSEIARIEERLLAKEEAID